MFCITKWCKSITDNHKDVYTHREKLLKENLKNSGKENTPLFRFRLLDDDGIIYAYGLSTDNETEAAFAPLDRYEGAYGCTSIEYKNTISGKYEEL